MSKNILWQNLSAAEIRKMIREWPGKDGNAAETKKARVVAKTPVIKVPAVKTKAKVEAKPADRARKHFGADGEVKFVAHRNIWIGFFGGKAVVKRSTEQACRETLKAQFGAVHQG
jgi:hypothetical protein